jgi:hypothetical protein
MNRNVKSFIHGRELSFMKMTLGEPFKVRCSVCKQVFAAAPIGERYDDVILRLPEQN